MTILANILSNIGHDPAAQYASVLKWTLIVTAALLVMHLVISLARGKGERRPRWRLLTSLIYLATVGSVFVLAATSFYSVLDHGAMHGWLLLLHAASAGGFVVCLMLIAVMWAWPARPFADRGAEVERSEQDLRLGPPGSLALPDGDAAETTLPRFSPFTKLTYWLILISGVVTAGSMLVSMLPLMGTQSLLEMITLHRYAGLVLVVATALHAYTVLLGRLGRA